MAEPSGDRRAPWNGARCRMDVASSSSMLPKLLQETEIGEGKLLTPILGLGFNWSCIIQAQNKYGEDHISFAMGLQFLYQTHSEIIKGDKQVNWVKVSGLSYRLGSW
ncbi:hypothetical protein PIB30_042366 [Stylosanthes scabra]|uniref:Uncharacterized protein n=1 Tax=Stylosanthes scabra TaxID=79078 RepID=A0ABU6UGG5_9FABA|nr:hypothetical protein [Stylosanthes scabra]